MCANCSIRAINEDCHACAQDWNSVPAPKRMGGQQQGQEQEQEQEAPQLAGAA